MIACSQCQHSNPGTAQFCESCGAVLKDPRRAEREADQVEASFLLDQVKKARGALLVVAILGTLGGIFEVVTAPAGETGFYIAINAVVWGAFYGLWWWSAKRPFPAAVIGLTIYIGLHTLAAIGDPSMIYKGIIVKVIIIIILVRAISAGFKHRNFVRSRGLD